jgi:hypothetical protein
MHACVICNVEGMAPAVVPYLGKAGHVWAHPTCAQVVYEAREAKVSPTGDTK